MLTSEAPNLRSSKNQLGEGGEKLALPENSLLHMKVGPLQPNSLDQRSSTNFSIRMDLHICQPRQSWSHPSSQEQTCWHQSLLSCSDQLTTKTGHIITTLLHQAAHSTLQLVNKPLSLSLSLSPHTHTHTHTPS